MESHVLGRLGEDLAGSFLAGKGYRVTEKNYKTRFGEIDLIAEYGGYIVFVEVKLRRSKSFAAAREFVTRSKRDKIIQTAEIFLQERPTELQPRFDVIEIYAPGGADSKLFKINHLENAFE